VRLSAEALTALLTVVIIERITVALKHSSLTPWIHQVGGFPGSFVISRTTAAMLKLLKRFNGLLPKRQTMERD
jgi:hypothetical protein